MGYRTTQLLFFFRKISRDEENKGDIKRRIFSGLLAAVLVCAWNAVELHEVPLRAYEEESLLNLFFNIRGIENSPDEIAIVNIDDTSFKTLKLSAKRTFPRELLGEALIEIQKDKPKVVILDLKASYDELEEKGTLRIVEALKMGPAVLAAPPIENTDDTFKSDERISEVAAMELPLTVNGAFGVTSNLGIATSSEEGQFDAFPLLKPLTKLVKSNIVTPDYRGIINFYGPAGTIKNFPVWQLVSDKRMVPKEFFKDKIVFVGYNSELTMRGVTNKEVFKVTAPGQNMYGVEIHATIAGNLLDNSWIRRLPPEVESITIMLLLFILILGIFFLEPLSAVIFVTSFTGLWFVGSYLAFLKLHYFFPGFLIALFSTPLILCGVMTTVARLALTELEDTRKMLGIK